MNFTISQRWRSKIFDTNMAIVVTCIIIVVTYNFIYQGFHCGIIVLVSYLAGIYFCKLIISAGIVFYLKYLDDRYTPANGSKNDAGEPKYHVQIPYPIDQALEQIFCRVLNQYISNWYCHISSDSWFPLEVRVAIRCLVTNLYMRIAQINVDRFLFCKVIPILLRHLVETSDEISHLHIAVRSRKSEILYTQNLLKHSLKHLLPLSSLNCKLYNTLLREITSKSLLLFFSDTICNPAVLNHLILRCFDKNFNIKRFPNDQTSDTLQVELLQKFLDNHQTYLCCSSLRPNVNDIIKDEELRNTFLRYLRGCDTEYILQFCLDVDSFNEKILKPELDTEELDNLYKDGWDLFSVYFSNYSPNCINFHKDLASPLRKALSKDILKLRTTTTLFEAYEYAFSLLNEYCQDFHNSIEFYHWLYGHCDGSDSTLMDGRSSQWLSTAKEGFGRKTVTEIGNTFTKIKDVLKPDFILEGRSRNSYPCGTDSESHSVEMGIDIQASPAHAMNISKWKITIPKIDLKLDPITNETFVVLKIHILDENDAEWWVERRFSELRSLYLKLAEIYKGNVETQFLLSKCSTLRLNENVQVYEVYLNDVIRLPDLKNSEILYNFFMSSEYMEDEVIDDAEEEEEEDDDDDDDDDEEEEVVGVDVGLVIVEKKEKEEEEEEEEEGYNEVEEAVGSGKIFRKSVTRPPSLKKERGQNLETFVNSVMSSCLPKKSDCSDVGENKSANKTHLRLNTGYLFDENNFDVNEDTSQMTCNAELAKLSNKRFFTPFTLVIYIAFKVYHVRMEVIKFLLTWKSAFGKILDQFIFNVTNVYLNVLIKNSNPGYIINTIEWAMFDNDTEFNEEEIKKRIMKLLLDTKCDWLHPMYVLVFENLQDTKKNKQLFYNLTDVLVEELFPEISVSSAESSK